VSAFPGTHSQGADEAGQNGIHFAAALAQAGEGVAAEPTEASCQFGLGLEFKQAALGDSQKSAKFGPPIAPESFRDIGGNADRGSPQLRGQPKSLMGGEGAGRLITALSQVLRGAGGGGEQGCEGAGYFA
jgi:hypothetical protein